VPLLVVDAVHEDMLEHPASAKAAQETTNIPSLLMQKLLQNQAEELQTQTAMEQTKKYFIATVLRRGDSGP
jgi:hypothetical protein